jgi:hypothetical protein
MAEDNDLQEVKPLREPERDPECCGRRMRKLQHASPSTGQLLTVFSCERCGRQMRVPPAVRPGGGPA